MGIQLSSTEYCDLIRSTINDEHRKLSKLRADLAALERIAKDAKAFDDVSALISTRIEVALADMQEAYQTINDAYIQLDELEGWD